MDRALQANVITKSGRAVETAGDVDTLLLDKTGTITIGNRKATRFHPIAGTDPAQLIRTCMLSSVSDETPEGKSILELGRSQNVTINDMEIAGARMIKFTAETKCSGARPGGRTPDPQRSLRGDPQDRRTRRDTRSTQRWNGP